jgi:hypothetical protein
VAGDKLDLCPLGIDQVLSFISGVLVPGGSHRGLVAFMLAQSDGVCASGRGYGDATRPTKGIC